LAKAGGCLGGWAGQEGPCQNPAGRVWHCSAEQRAAMAHQATTVGGACERPTRRKKAHLDGAGVGSQWEMLGWHGQERPTQDSQRAGCEQGRAAARRIDGLGIDG
jgi:hypothetical protein